jgi:hypothetical protein
LRGEREAIKQFATRRGFMKGATALSAPPVIGLRFAAAQSRTVLRYRIFTDMQVLDPPFRVTAPRATSSPRSSLVWSPSSRATAGNSDQTPQRRSNRSTTPIFKLRKDLKWTGGFGELTAEDVKCFSSA